MSIRRRPASSLIDDICAAAAHQTEEIAFLRNVLELVSKRAHKGASDPLDNGHQLRAIAALVDEALSMQGGAE